MKKWNEIPEIVFENTEIIIVNKPVGLPSQSDLTGDASLLEIFESERRQKLHLINRLDRPVSGAILLAKSERTQNIFQNEVNIFKSYIAIVNPVSFESMWLENFLTKDGKRRKAYVQESSENTLTKARMLVHKVASLNRYDVLQLQLMKGRFHQIRCQLGHISSPIKGDVKYGARRANKNRSIDLHAFGIYIPDRGISATAPINRTEPIWVEISNLDKLNSFRFDTSGLEAKEV